MTYLHFDATAQEILAARRATQPETALCVRLERRYARGLAPWVPVARWSSEHTAARSPQLVRQAGPGSMPLFIERRLWRYLSWHPLPVVGQRFGPFTRLLVAVDPLFGDTLRTWERQHPDLEPGAPSAVA